MPSVRLRCQSSDAGASRKTDGRCRSNSRFLCCTKAPPPSATTLSHFSDSSRRSRSALVSASRNPGSPRSRKISGMVCRSRDSIRASRSTKSQFSRRASSCPTLLLPDAMNPTRNTARTSMALHGTSKGDVVTPGSRPFVPIGLYYCSALLEADFTTESAQHDFRCCLADRTKEGTSRFHGEPGVLGLERKIVLHLTQHGVRAEIRRDIPRRQSFDITGVGGELIVASGAEITVVENLSAAGFRLNQRSRNRFQVHVAADRSDVDVAVANIAERDRSAHRPHVHMAVIYVTNIHNRIRAFQRQVALQVLGRQRTGRRTEIEGSVGRNQHFVVNLAALLVRSLQQVGRDFYPVAILQFVDFHFVRLERGRHHHLIAASRLHRDRPILRIHGNARVGTYRETVFLLGLGARRRCQTGCQNQRYNRVLPKTSVPKTRHKTLPLRPATPGRPSPIEYDLTQSGKEVLSVDTHPSDAAGHLRLPDSDLRMPVFPVCRHSPLAIHFHKKPASKGQGWTPHSETVDLPRSVRVLPQLLP